MTDNKATQGFAPPPGMNIQENKLAQHFQSDYPQPHQQQHQQQPGGYPSSSSTNYTPGFDPKNAAGYTPMQQQGYPPFPDYQPPHVQPGGFQPGGFQPTGHLPPHIYAPNVVTGDSDDPTVKGFQFNDETIRRGFIRKVNYILAAQLLCTLSFVLFFVFIICPRYSIHNNPNDPGLSVIFMLGIVAAVITFITIIMLSCCESVRRTSPTNIIVLGIFTVCESYVVSIVTLAYEPHIVLLAVLVTAGVCVGVAIFAVQTKFDFTVFGGVLFVALFVFILLGIFAPFLHRGPGELIMAWAGAILFCIYLIYDIQLMVGGDHRYKLDPEEYILGAVAIYLDILNIFLYILKILGSSKDS